MTPMEKKERKQKFIELVAQGKKPYPAAIEAGYTVQYAKAHSGDLLEKCRNEIEALKPIAKAAIEEEFKYTAKESFKKLQEIQELALKLDDKGNYTNLSAAIKAEELKGRLFGAYEQDNTQKTTPELKIVVKSNNED